MEFAAAYIRVSEDKDDNKVSPEQQLNSIKHFINKNNWSMINEQGYMDISVSGGNMIDRPAFNRMLEDIEKYQIKHICFYDLTRYTRNIFDFMDMTRELQKKGVKLHSVSDNRLIDLQNWNSDALLSIILALFGHNEREVIRSKVASNMEQLARDGYSVGGPAPFGLKKVDITTPEGKTRGSYAYDTPEKVELVRLIYKWYIEDRMSDSDIVRKLNSEYLHMVDKENALKYRKDKYLNEIDAPVLWNKSKVTRILTNPLYTGYMVSRRRKRLSKRKHVANDKENWIWSNNFVNGQGPDFDAVIPYAVWEKAQEIRALKNPNERKEYEPQREKSPYLLSGLLNCGYCGRKMLARKTKNNYGKEYKYYYCRIPSTSNICENKSKTPCKEIDHKVLMLFKNSLLLFDILKGLNEYQKESSKNANEFIIKSTELDNKIRLLSEQQDNLINDIAQTNVESLKKKFIQKAEELEQEIIELKEEKEKLIQQNESIKLKKINFRGLVDMLLHSEEYLKNFDDIPKLRRYLRSMIDRVVYFKDRVEVHFKLLKQEIIFDIVPSEVFELKKKELETEKGNISKIKVKEQDNKMLLYLLGELWDRQELGKQDERLLNLIVEVMEEYKKLSIKEHTDRGSLPPPA